MPTFVEPPFDNPDQLRSSLCRDDFETFVRTFWGTVPGVGPLVWNWHMTVFCKELQHIAERVFAGLPLEYDLAVNVPFGTSKSTIFSILFHPWCWTRMPGARFLVCSHSSDLVMDLSSKARDVLRSEKYNLYFPEIEVRDDTDAKGHYRNTHGGERKICTVSGVSPIGFHAHCIICLPWESRIMTDAGVLPIGKIVDEKLPVKVLGYDTAMNSVRWQTIEAYEKNPGKPLCCAVLSDGTKLEATNEHPVYVIGKGYIPISELEEGDELVRVSPVRALWSCDEDTVEVQAESQEWKGVLHQQVQGIVSFRENHSQDVSSVLPVRRGDTTPSNTKNHHEDGLGVLFSGLSGFVHERGEPSEIQQRQKELRSVWRGDDGKSIISQAPEILQLQMLWTSHARGEQSEGEEEDRIPMRMVWKGDEVNAVLSRIWPAEVLYQDLCKQGPIQKDERGRECELYWRGYEDQISPRADKNQGESKGTGQALLSSMREDKDGEWKGDGCSPCGLGQVEQRYEQFGVFMSGLPLEASRRSEETTQTSTCFVVSVEREVRLPATVYNLRTAEDHNYFAEGILVHNCDDPLDPKEALSEVKIKTAEHFITEVLPGRKVDKNITPTILVMQRLGVGDPTDVMLREAAKEGAMPLRHVCLPGEIIHGDGAREVAPPEYAFQYINGLLDPIRLPRRVLDSYKARGEHFYATQVLQKPFVRGGGMFKESYFPKARRVKAAPFYAKRLWYTDRAATPDGGCATCATLMAQDEKGNTYVEEVIHGHWEPTRRDQELENALLRTRMRYGGDPSNEPVMWVEQEPGSSGIDSFQALARKLAGFVVKADRPTGSKQVRAEPWASQCAAGTVWLVDNGASEGLGTATWDIDSWIKEHCAFPMGKLLDRVDSASGAFTKLTGARSPNRMRVYFVGEKKQGAPQRVVICSREELGSLMVDDHRVLLVSLQDPAPKGDGLPPGHALTKLQGQLVLQFADLMPQEYQDKWGELVMPYGKKCEELVMTADQGKELWRFILQKRDPPWELLVIQDDGDRRAVSMGYAICDALYLLRKKSFCRLADLNDDHLLVGGDKVEAANGHTNGKVLPPEKAPNHHVFSMVKASKHAAAVGVV